MKPAPIRRALLGWFHTNKRKMPWRGAKDPYCVWLSEMMLQQTRVTTVIPYYRRFLRAFPSVRALARARLNSVLRLWAGLGYYSRARNLHAAAKIIVRKHGGRFPSTLEAALALPGIGPYTARAILSIAYNKPLAVVDGNVARVLARLFPLETHDNSRTSILASVRRVRPSRLTLTGRKRAGALAPDVLARGIPATSSNLQLLADQLVDPRRPGDFNQALMELGSTICLPRAPRCPACPLERLCAARRNGTERALGLRRVRRTRPTTTLCILVARRNGNVLLAREPNGLFSGLWHFPYSIARTPTKLAQQLGANRLHRLGTVEHEMTARRLLLRVYEAEVLAGRVSTSALTLKVAKKPGALAPEVSWVRPQDISRLGVGAATRRIAAALETGVDQLERAE